MLSSIFKDVFAPKAKTIFPHLANIMLLQSVHCHNIMCSAADQRHFDIDSRDSNSTVDTPSKNILSSFTEMEMQSYLPEGKGI